jgi:hypothetical protein
MELQYSVLELIFKVPGRTRANSKISVVTIFQVSVCLHQPDMYIVFITQLSVWLWQSFMPTVFDVKVFPMCIVDAI